VECFLVEWHSFKVLRVNISSFASAKLAGVRGVKKELSPTGVGLEVKANSLGCMAGILCTKVLA
jgi:hypothetical protein